jgi:1-deoxy-D-xylulose-5-phosphate reductoisomerase
MIHSMVEFVDGSTIAQASPPDTAADLARPRLAEPRSRCRRPARLVGGAQPDVRAARRRRVPGSRVGETVGTAGSIYPAVFNAATEQAVAAFLAGTIGYLAIVETVERVVDAHEPATDLTRESLVEAEA